MDLLGYFGVRWVILEFGVVHKSTGEGWICMYGVLYMWGMGIRKSMGLFRDRSLIQRNPLETRRINSEERRSATIDNDQKRTSTAHEANSGRQQLLQEIAGRYTWKHELTSTSTMSRAIGELRQSSSINNKVGGISHCEAFCGL
jgi:hypothetical protein